MVNIIIVVVLALIILWFVVIFNRFIRLKNLVKEAWSGIDVQLKRRYDLIPNLIETVKGYAQHERKLFEDIASLRSKCMSIENVKEKGIVENSLTQMVRSLFAIAEAYPDLKASQNFLDMQKNLADIESEIQLARRYYNGTARDFNILTESFPSIIISNLFGFKQFDFFEVESAIVREVPKVSFTSTT